MAVSRTPYLLIAATIFATLFVGFGINGIVRPRSAFEVFEFDLPASPADQKLVNSLMVLYGVRDIFMGVAIYSAAYFGTRNTLGLILVAGSGVAFVDGAVCRAQIGRGQWNHWGYAPALTLVGALLLGGLGGKDKAAKDI